MAESVVVKKGEKYLNSQGTFGGRTKANPFATIAAAKGFMTRKKVLGKDTVTFESIEPAADTQVVGVTKSGKAVKQKASPAR